MKRYEKDGMMVGRRVADEFILVPIRQNVGDLQSMYTLNDVASRIWEFLDDSHTIDELVARLVEEFEVEAPEAEADLIEFLDQMKEIGAVVEK